MIAVLFFFLPFASTVIEILPFANTYNVFLNDEKKTFLQSAFLDNGSITDPAHEYHLEITTDDLEMTNKIISVLKEFGINTKYIEKKYSTETLEKLKTNSISFLENLKQVK